MIWSSQFGQAMMPARTMSQDISEKQPVPNAKRRRNSIRQVLDAALSLFVRSGFDGTSMDDIAAGAGLTKGALDF